MIFKSWLTTEEETSARLESLLSPFVFFFKKDSEYYGCDEESRLVFAKMKHPDEDLPSSWKDEANFSCFNLKKLAHGEPGQILLGIKDLKKISVVDKEMVEKNLKKEISDKPISLLKIGLAGDRASAPNLGTQDED